jgi:hypothetical protein
MTFGTAQRGTRHSMGTSDAVFIPRYRVIASLAVAKGLDGLNRYCYRGDLLDWLSEAQAKHLVGHGLVERIPDHEQAAAIAADAPQTVDIEAGEDADGYAPAAEESSVVDECLAALMHLQVPAAAGAPTARTALRDAGHRFGNDVIAHAVRRRKELSGTADDEEFEAVEF